MVDVKLKLKTQLDEESLAKLRTQLGKAGDIFATVGKAGVAGIGAVGGVLATTTVSAINFADEVNEAVTSLSKQTGASGMELEEYKKITTDIFAGPPPVGDSILEVADALAQTQNTTQLTGDALEQAAKDATNLAGTFDKDVNEVLRAADSLVRNKVAPSFDEAFDLIAKGFQEGGDRGDDFLDTLNEYAQDFGDLGFTAQETFNVIQNGLEAGILNTDKIGDAINEAFINFRDPGRLEGIDEILSGLSEINDESRVVADEISNNFDAFNEGSRSGAVALDVLLDSLSKVEDPLIRNQLGVEVFGSLWEDLGENAILALQSTDEQLDDLENGIDNISGSMDELADKPQTLEQLWDSAWRNIQVAIEPLGQELIPLISEKLLQVIDVIQTDEFKDLARQFGVDLKEAFDTTVDALGKISEAFGLAEEDASGAEKAISALVSVVNGASSVINFFADGAEQAAALADQIDTILELLDGFGERAGFSDAVGATTGTILDNAFGPIGAAASDLFGFQNEGFVPGPSSRGVPIMAHGGELVLNPEGGSQGGGTIVIQGESFIAQQADRLASLINRQREEDLQGLVDQLATHMA